MFEPGLENFLRIFQCQNKLKAGIVTNHTARNRNGEHLVELIAQQDELDLARIFSPEHGFFSSAPDGEAVDDILHPKLGLPVISLYGKNKKPSAEMLEDLDVLIYDIQDVGARFYTYISTLRNILDAAAEASVPVWILDRPNATGGVTVEGPCLDPEFTSFVGHLPVPVRYGLTPGELALWWQDHANLELEIKIWQCSEYICNDKSPYPDFPWYQSSPGMPDVATAQFYPGTCIFEGTQVSEGRGTDAPFRKLGAPWIDADLWLLEAKKRINEEIEIETCSFTPTFSKYALQECRGIFVHTQHGTIKNAFKLALDLLDTLMRTHPDQVDFTLRPGLKYPFFDYLCGTDIIRKSLLKQIEPELFMVGPDQITAEFARKRQKFFLYDRIIDD